MPKGEEKMPPSVRITKEDIIKTAMELVRKNGEDAINARAIASALGCSTQPVFSNFASMVEVREAVIEAAEALCAKYSKEEMERGEYPVYKASGMGYIRFAKEERELFRLVYMCDRSAEQMAQEDRNFSESVALVSKNTGLGEDEARVFHLEMWAFVHGIATMYATGFLDLDRELVSRMLSDAYLGMKKQYERE